MQTVVERYRQAVATEGSEPAAASEPGLARPVRDGRALGRDSTREELAATLTRRGFIDLPETDLVRVWDAFQELVSQKAAVTIRDLDALVEDRLRATADQYQLLRMETRTRTGEPAWARVELLERNSQAPLDAEGTGDGPIDAALSAVVDAISTSARLVAFSIEALSTGSDALCEAHLTVAVDGRHFAAEGVASSLTEAGVRAFLRALSAARLSERAGRSADQ